MQPLETREIRRSGLRPPPIGLGCWGMSFAYGALDERQCLATIQRAIH